VLLQDKSWRVRYNVAAQMVPLCEALGPEMTRAELVPAYTKLLEDTEAEVRIAAAGKVSAFSRMLTPALIVSQVSLRPGHVLLGVERQHPVFVFDWLVQVFLTCRPFYLVLFAVYSSTGSKENIHYA
jgi:hypothetical protein